MPDGLSSTLRLPGQPEREQPKRAPLFYVYEHWRPDLNLCFYVGKGTKKRSGKMTARNARHLAIQEELETKELKVEVRLIRSFTDELEAFDFECRRIGEYPISQLVNMTGGGEGMSNPSPETRAKLSAQRLGKKRGPHTAEAKRKMSEALTGRKLSPETRAKMSATRKGRICTEKTRALLSEARKNRKFGPETRAKMSAAKKGKKRPITSPEHRAALSRALMGHSVSEEVRAKLRAFNLGRKKTQIATQKEQLCLPMD